MTHMIVQLWTHMTVQLWTHTIVQILTHMIVTLWTHMIVPLWTHALFYIVGSLPGASCPPCPLLLAQQGYYFVRLHMVQSLPPANTPVSMCFEWHVERACTL
jgi:hypothetical protein